MKMNLCFGCQRFFREDYLFCPYCGKELSKEVTILDEKQFVYEDVGVLKPNESVSARIKRSKEIKQGFYSTLFPREKLFINDFYDIIKCEYPFIDIKHDKTCSYFYKETDKLILKHYAHWFFFGKKDGVLQLRYRTSPSIKLATKIINITENTDVDMVAQVIIDIINKRLRAEKQ